jgi:hypothetical protein
LIISLQGDPAMPEQRSPLKEKIEKYYKVSEEGDLSALLSFLPENVERWYDRENISNRAVIKGVGDYNKAYPYRRVKILWDTYKVEPLPDGSQKVQYELYYEIRGKNSEKTLKYHLAIFAVWTADMKIKSVYEIKI